MFLGISTANFNNTPIAVLFGICFALLYIITCITSCVMPRQRLIGLLDYRNKIVANDDNSNTYNNHSNKDNNNRRKALYRLLERFSILAYCTISIIVIIDNFIIGQTALLQFIEINFATLNATNDVICMACQFDFLMINTERWRNVNKSSLNLR